MKRLLLLASLFPAAVHAQPDKSFMRFAAVHGDQIVFVSHGNLWEVSTAGGTAHRLTSDPGEDTNPRFSPDGKWIAFTASYQGNQDVYVIPAAGGVARRLTFHSDIVPHAPDRWGPDNMVLTWTPDSQKIVFLTRSVAWNTWYSRPFAVPLAGGLPEPLPLDRAGMMSYSPDGNSIAYNRIFRNFRTWKRYDGGLAQDIYRYDFPTRKLSRITDYHGTSTDPMWAGNKIFYLSDRDANRRANIWVHDLDAKTDVELTHFTEYDIDFPSIGGNVIVFAEGGSLYTLNIVSGALTRLDVRVPDDGTRTQARFVNAAKFIRESDPAGGVDFALSPNGKRVLLCARGDIFSLPAEHGATRNLTVSSNADEDHPAWSPDGTRVAYVTDVTGNEQIAVRPATGGAEQIVTHFPGGYFYTPVFSPDGKSLLVSDANHRLLLITIDGGAVKQIAQNIYGEIHDAVFSPDGRFVAFSQSRPTHLDSIFLFEIASGRLTQLSSDMDDDSSPVFSQDGKYLVFYSNRHENPVLAANEQNIADLKTGGLYIAPLTAGAPSPFAPQSDEGAVSAAKKETPPEYKPGNSKPIHIDIAGLLARAVAVPVEDANIVALDIRGDMIFYQTKPLSKVEGDLAGEKSVLHSYNLADRKDGVVIEGLDSYALSADGSKILIYMDHGFSVIDAKPDQKADAAKHVALDAMRTRIFPTQEWAEMFENAWRLERDLFFNPKMNGVNWQAVHDSYAKLLPLVGSREDLTYLIGQVQGELGNSHTYVNDGDEQNPTPDAPTPLLGADFALDAARDKYVFARVLPGDNTREAYRSPLTVPGVDVKSGDYLLAINGHEVKPPETPFSAMAGVQGPVTLTVAAKAEGPKRDVVVEPVKQELSLREQAWIDHNRALVDKLSGGKIAYVYLSNMESLGMEQFLRQFYPQADRHALIMDDRWNGGGFIDQIVLERLRRVLVGMSTNREAAQQSIPGSLIDGPKICLMNHYSASDGDIFPYFFRKYGLGPLLGTRTWGGVRGIRGNWDFIDGGGITVPEDSLYGLDSHWVMENRGVEPDISIEDDPADIMADKDKQLEAAVAYLLGELNKDPHDLPEVPAWVPAYPAGAVPFEHGN